MTTTVMWFRRDLRLADNPALLAARDSGAEVVGVFVVDPRLLNGAGARGRRLLASVAELRDRTGGALVIRTGDPAEVVTALAGEVHASTVHVSAETTPYGRTRDRRVARALSDRGRELVATGTPYAVGPGVLRSGAGTPYRVFTPYLRAWRRHGWPAPAPRPGDLRWATGISSEKLPEVADDYGGDVGEAAALRRWHRFRDRQLADYRAHRDRPDLDDTSRLSVFLKAGELHPRTVLADLAAAGLAGTEAATTFVAELCWREFYADVLWHSPQSAWRDWRVLPGVDYDTGPRTDRLVQAWREGRTGYPMVDAGMRQLLGEGWMHNRLRMLTASFLVKDLHVWWPVGARHFLSQLLDGDLASNNHGWQWVAGTGTDAVPYHRVFNPVLQGRKFDPEGTYVRRWVPELRHLRGADVHEPWKHAEGYARGYPERIVDHGEERLRALARHRGGGDDQP